MDVSEAGQCQQTLGWGIALEGCLVMQWQEEQDRFWKAFKSWQSSKCWTSALIQRLMMTTWNMWQDHNEVLHNSETNHQAILEADTNQQITDAHSQDQEKSLLQ